MQTYVVGFLFRKFNSEVLLIKKAKPEWQAGRLNGVGGKIEPGETPLEAMIREFREETSCTVGDWEEFFVLTVPGVAKIHFFKRLNGGQWNPQTMTEEPVAWFRHIELRFPAVAGGNPLWNLNWLIPLALDVSSPVGVAENQA